jgi:hypothetical protein
MAKRSVWFQIRRDLGAHTSCPVIILPGDFPPTLEGKPGGWVRALRYAPVWGRARTVYRTDYNCSTLVIWIGKEWLERERPEIMGRILTERMLCPTAYRAELRGLK